MTKSPDLEPIGGNAVIVCAHVAEGQPILHAERDEPVDAADSGWQFLCGALEEDSNDVQIWSINEIVSADPSLAPFMDMPAGTRLMRSGVGDRWRFF